ncbi:MAG: hypothetical protein H0X25_12425 [Acidobacteriales bacterium]|nr:hypothetical protein [Terriglobales bacterium]
MTAQKKPKKCTMCKNLATRVVDGEPSCDAHAGKIYEHQVEDYISEHEKDNEWLELMSDVKK